MRIDISIGKLAEYIEEYKSIKLIDNTELSVNDCNITVPTPSGNATVNYIIKKTNLPMLQIKFDNSYIIEVAKQHIFRQNNHDVYASDLHVGDYVDHINGPIMITDIVYIDNADCYDISIPAPYYYYDTNGVIHHNTLLTATLSKLIEPYGRSIVIVPSKSLVEQTEADYINLGLDVGVLYGDRKEYDRTHTICTWQSLNVLDKNSKDALDENQHAVFMQDLICVIVDECFDGNELVLTPSGYIPIKDIKVGDSVINYSETTNEFKTDTVVKQHINLTRTHSEKMYELVFDNNKIIKVTGNHKFLTQLGWCRADELTAEHDIINTDINTYY